jgi:hypothetical protein
LQSESSISVSENSAISTILPLGCSDRSRFPSFFSELCVCWAQSPHSSTAQAYWPNARGAMRAESRRMTRHKVTSVLFLSWECALRVSS